MEVRIILNYFENDKFEEYSNKLLNDAIFLDIGSGLMEGKYNFCEYNYVKNFSGKMLSKHGEIYNSLTFIFSQ